MSLSQHLPEPEPFLYDTTLRAEAILESEDELDMLLIADGSPHFKLPLYCRVKISVQGLSEENKGLRIKNEVQLMKKAMINSIHDYAIREGIFTEEVPGILGERYIHSYDNENKLFCLKVLTQKGTFLGDTVSRYSGEGVPQYADVKLEVLKLRRQFNQYMVMKYPGDDYRALTEI